MSLKRCQTCSLLKEQTEFYRHPTTADRVVPNCKSCLSDYYFSRKEEGTLNAKEPDHAVKSKRCRVCDRVRPVSKFYAHPTGRDGHQARCKDCVNRIAKLRRAAK